MKTKSNLCLNRECCTCKYPDLVVSSPIDTVETCKYCGKIVDEQKLTIVDGFLVNNNKDFL
jgi:hypothetical protein